MENMVRRFNFNIQRLNKNLFHLKKLVSLSLASSLISARFRPPCI